LTKRTGRQRPSARRREYFAEPQNRHPRHFRQRLGADRTVDTAGATGIKNPDSLKTGEWPAGELARRGDLVLSLLSDAGAGCTCSPQ